MSIVVKTADEVIKDVISGFTRVADQDVVVTNALIAARQFRIDQSILVCKSLEVKGVTALGLSKAVVAEKAARQERIDAGEDVSADFADDIAYTSDTGIGWLATVGVLFQLETGAVPTDVGVGDICMDIKDATKKFADSVLRRRGVSQDVAYAEIHKQAESVRDAKKAAKKAAKTAAMYLKAIQQMWDKALSMDLDVEAATTLGLMMRNGQAALDFYTEQKAEKAAQEGQEQINAELAASLENALENAS